MCYVVELCSWYSVGTKREVIIYMVERLLGGENI